jgi:hypothetical protein
MHRRVVIAVLAAALLVPTLQAQMRGVSARGPVHVAPRMAPATRMMGAPRRAGTPAGFGLRTSPGFRRGPIIVNRGFRHFHHHQSFFNSGCFNGAFVDPFCRSQFFVAPPIFWPSFDYGMQAYPVAQQVPSANYDDSALRVQIERLTDEVDRLREEQAARNNPPPPPVEARPTRAEPPTILVYRDGHRSEIQNYGIVGQTLWIFTERHAKKVALGDLDLEATKAANEERGVGFVLPDRR